MESERNPVFSLVAERAPEVAIEMPVEFMAGLSAFDVKGYSLSEEFRFVLPKKSLKILFAQNDWHTSTLKLMSAKYSLKIPEPCCMFSI